MPQPCLLILAHAELDGRMLLCGSPNNMRLGYLWENQPGVWRRRVPVRTTVSRLRVMRKDQLETLLTVRVLLGQAVT
jgi:hypothetical protein